ncbi:CDP-alcohol phosphatidyltransferase family protein [Myxococcota bacterium]|nr:CDP-alcohol phosphatidyltransferase family protein [Myxococcota bacterium]
MIKSLLGDHIDGWVHACFPFLFRRRLSPNALTVVGTLVSTASAICFARGEFVAGGVLILAGGFFDLVDGVVARHQGDASRFGAFLDSVLDRFVDMVLLLGMAVHFSATQQLGQVLLTAWTLVATVLVSYSQARAQLFLPDFRVGLMERGERMLVLALGAVSGFLVAGLWVVAIGSTITVVQRFALAHRELSRVDRDGVGGSDS